MDLVAYYEKRQTELEGEWHKMRRKDQETQAEIDRVSKELEREREKIDREREKIDRRREELKRSVEKTNEVNETRLREKANCDEVVTKQEEKAAFLKLGQQWQIAKAAYADV